MAGLQCALKRIGFVQNSNAKRDVYCRVTTGMQSRSMNNGTGALFCILKNNLT